jgi:hypothetical protein
VNEQQQLLVPFWEVVLDKSPDEMKIQTTMASHFAKVNSVFMSKKPAEVSWGFLEKSQKQLLNTLFLDAGIYPSPTFDRRPST